MRLAEHLHKSLTEIDNMPAWELTLWQAHSELKHEESGGG